MDGALTYHQPGTVTHRGRSVGFIEHGEGSWAVLLPPGAASGRAWKTVSERLADSVRSVCVHPSGHESTDSYRGKSLLRLDDEAEAVIEVMRHLRLSRSHLVGHSYGGAIALKLALRWPDWFKSLSLIEPAAYPVLNEAGENSLAMEVEQVNRLFIERVHRGEARPALESYVNYYNGSIDAWRNLSDRLQRKLLDIADTIAAALGAVHASSIRLTQCASVSLPTLLIHGTQTDPVHARVTALLAETIRTSRLEQIRGAGHMASLTHPGEVATLLRSHFEHADLDSDDCER